MLHEALTYYRKKNLLTQEELADKLCVSRQTITKWEAGMITPGVEYLIDLSELFGVTIDQLLKEDDCAIADQEQFAYEPLVSFIVEAKRSTYASKQHQVDALRKQSHEYQYQQGAYTYIDSYVGNSQFAGQELVYEHEQIRWSMNYFGTVYDASFQSDVLKYALRQVTEQWPYRGPACISKGEYTYISQVTGDVTLFHGVETIYYRNARIYEATFQGGILK